MKLIGLAAAPIIALTWIHAMPFTDAFVASGIGIGIRSHPLPIARHQLQLHLSLADLFFTQRRNAEAADSTHAKIETFVKSTLK